MTETKILIVGATAVICLSLGITSGIVLVSAAKLKCRLPIVETRVATVILIVGR